MKQDVPKFIEKGARVVVNVLADPETEDSAWNRGKNGLWEVTGFRFEQRPFDDAERLYVTLRSLEKKNTHYITLPFDARVIRPEPTLAEAFRAEIHAPRKIVGPAPARFRKPGHTP